MDASQTPHVLWDSRAAVVWRYLSLVSCATNGWVAALDRRLAVPTPANAAQIAMAAPATRASADVPPRGRGPGRCWRPGQSVLRRRPRGARGARRAHPGWRRDPGRAHAARLSGRPTWRAEGGLTSLPS